MGGRRTRRRAGEEVMADICSRSQGETGSDGEEEGGTGGRGEGAKRRPDVTQTTENPGEGDSGEGVGRDSSAGPHHALFIACQPSSFL